MEREANLGSVPGDDLFLQSLPPLTYNVIFISWLVAHSRSLPNRANTSNPGAVCIVSYPLP